MNPRRYNAEQIALASVLAIAGLLFAVGLAVGALSEAALRTLSGDR